MDLRAGTPKLMAQSMRFEIDAGSYLLKLGSAPQTIAVSVLSYEKEESGDYVVLCKLPRLSDSVEARQEGKFNPFGAPLEQAVLRIKPLEIESDPTSGLSGVGLVSREPAPDAA